MKKLQHILYIFLVFNLLTTFVCACSIKGLTNRVDNSAYLSELEREVVEELNLARTQPSTYANFLTDFSKLYVGKELREPGETTILTNEGRSAVNEAIRFLKNQKSLSDLTPSKGMSKAAEDMVRMQENTTQIGHTGRDGSSFFDRISRYGTWSGSCGENIDYGNNTARRIVMALIIDDGVSNRGHRKSIFTPAFKKVGVAFGQHKRYEYMCVIEFAVGYTER